MNWKVISKEVFGLILRIIGLAFLYQGLNSVPNAITSLSPGFSHFYWRNLFPAILIVGWPSVIGYYLVRRAPFLMDLAYGPDPRSQESPEKPAGSPSGRFL